MELTNKEKKHLQSVSRLLAKVLRHTPDELGVTLDAHGWVSVPTLLKALDEKGRKTHEFLRIPTMERPIGKPCN